MPRVNLYHKDHPNVNGIVYTNLRDYETFTTTEIPVYATQPDASLPINDTTTEKIGVAKGLRFDGEYLSIYIKFFPTTDTHNSVSFLPIALAQMSLDTAQIKSIECLYASPFRISKQDVSFSIDPTMFTIQTS